MEYILAFLTGILYASGLYMMLRRSMVKLLIGLILLGNGANMLIFLLGRIVKGAPPVISETEKHLSGVYADPVPQALILTAIVISFGLQAFAIILLKRVYLVAETDDLDELNTADDI